MFRKVLQFVIVPLMSLFITIGLYSWWSSHFLNKLNTPTESGSAAIGGVFTLTNQYGETVSDSKFRGKLMLVYFGFTHCPDICPTDLAMITAALNMLSKEEQEQVVPVFITLDPQRDTVEQMKQYAASFHPSLQALTGAKEDVQKVLSEYRVYSEKVESKDANDYQMNHSAYTYLMGRDGVYKTHFNHGQTADEIAVKIRENLLP